MLARKLPVYEAAETVLLLLAIDRLYPVVNIEQRVFDKAVLVAIVTVRMS